MDSGIYLITNIQTLKLYVGSSARITRRWGYHKSMLNKNLHPNNYLQNAWNKYGAAAFAFSIIEITSVKKLIDREQIWMDALCCHISDWGYNISPKAESSAGSKRTIETKKKISASTKSIMENPIRRVKLANFMRNNPKSLEWRRMGGAATKGRKMNEEVRAKISATLRGHAVSEETREKQAAAKRGKNLSDAHKKKIADSIQQYNLKRKVAWQA